MLSFPKCRTGTALSDATQKNAFSDESPSASEDNDDNDDDDDETVNEGSKHIVLGDREAEERIQRARDARKEFFESEHNTTVESYSSKRDDFDDEDEVSDNEEIPIDDPVTKVPHDDKGKTDDQHPERREKANLVGSSKEMSKANEKERSSQNKGDALPLAGEEPKYRTSSKQQDEDIRQEVVTSGKSSKERTVHTAEVRDGTKSGKGVRDSDEVLEGPKSGSRATVSREVREGPKSGKSGRESGGSTRSGATSTSSAVEGNKQ